MIESLMVVAIVCGALSLAGALVWTIVKLTLWLCGGALALVGGVFVLLLVGGLGLMFAPMLAAAALGALMLPVLVPLGLGAVLGYWLAHRRAANPA
jgi:hypothetical protein